jgi:hypothetical protein
LTSRAITAPETCAAITVWRTATVPSSSKHRSGARPHLRGGELAEPTQRRPGGEGEHQQ